LNDTPYRRVLAVLCESMSRINADALLNRALAVCTLTPETMESKHSILLMAPLAPGLRVFLGDANARTVLAKIRALHKTGVAPAARVEVRAEADILNARLAAREHCVAHGVSSFTQQRVLTVVSELARNIVAYSRGGHIDLGSDDGVITVSASDTGPGIPNLDEILAGRYRSRTGLGLGILGVKRLSTHMHIESAPEGTLVVAKVTLA
jgi:serine/threonine-protein kinase RsbT